MATRPPLAVITGASSGIGLELAKLAARDGMELILAADRPLADAQAALRKMGVKVESCEADLSTRGGVDSLWDRLGDRPVDYLFANAGHGLGGGFLDQAPEDWAHVINTNVTGTIDLIQRAGRRMRDQHSGRILITGSIAGITPGAFQAVYNGSKAFIDSFGFALRNELKDSGVVVTVLMPGATETDFFERAGMADTKVAQGSMDDAAMVAETGYRALMKGEDHVVAGWQNKLSAAIAQVTPSTQLAEQHRAMAIPGSGRD